MPHDPQGREECLGCAAFHVSEGHLDEVDLSGVDFALYNQFPSHLTAGNWKVICTPSVGAPTLEEEGAHRG
ncbi:DUF1326 domain-containing protein [Streptomyces hokutonensis]|uniref:DUF1326 domain-containing protein n=1 Tax=Streptomyces hokutonensis TaxID=1306990 RepID=UPI0034E25242